MKNGIKIKIKLRTGRVLARSCYKFGKCPKHLRGIAPNAFNKKGVVTRLKSDVSLPQYSQYGLD